MIISAIVGLHKDAVAQRKLMDVPGPIFVPLKLTSTLWLFNVAMENHHV